MEVEETGDITLLTNDIEEKILILYQKYEEITSNSTLIMEKSFANLRFLLIITSVVLLLVGFATAFSITRMIVNPIKYIRDIILEMGFGILPKAKLKVKNDEIGDMTFALNNLVEAMKRTTEFSNKIGSGQFDTIYTPLSKEDTLGKSLIKMRKSLKNAQEEDERRSWMAAGLALLGGILQETMHELDLCADKVIRSLTKYMGAQIGAIYYYNDLDKDNIILDLLASKGMPAEKKVADRISITDGLLGDCATEKQLQYITDLPDNYLPLKSGIGIGKPSSLLLVPLLHEGAILGVIEMAAIKTFSENEISFIQELGKRIASTFFSIKTNLRTISLLEESQSQASKLLVQEEELKNNVDKLEKSHGELLKAQTELQDANKILKNHEEHLENLVDERTAEVVRQKENIEKQNEELEEQKGQLNDLLEEQNKTANELKAANNELTTSNHEVILTNLELERQKEEIEIQNAKITSSITYAKRIQTAILPPTELISEIFQEYFIFYKPRDIVSGDFYWMKNYNGKTYIAVADCTGHGVPGAFMSMLGITFLNEIVGRERNATAGNILNELRDSVKKALRQTGKSGESQDGMDIAFCIIDTEKKELEFAGAHSPLYLFRNKELHITKGDRMPIGIYRKEIEFATTTLKLEENDLFYIFSDGFSDQFREDNEKFKLKRFKEMLQNIHEKPIEQHSRLLQEVFDDWKGKSDQMDDILIMGIKPLKGKKRGLDIGQN